MALTFTCSVTQVKNTPSSQCPLGLPTSPRSLHFLWKFKSNSLSTQPPNKTCLSKEQLSHPPPFTDSLSEEWWFLQRKKGRGKKLVVGYFFMKCFGFVLSPGLCSLERLSQNKYVRGHVVLHLRKETKPRIQHKWRNRHMYSLCFKTRILSDQL